MGGAPSSRQHAPPFSRAGWQATSFMLTDAIDSDVTSYNTSKRRPKLLNVWDFFQKHARPDHHGKLSRHHAAVVRPALVGGAVFCDVLGDWIVLFDEFGACCLVR